MAVAGRATKKRGMRRPLLPVCAGPNARRGVAALPSPPRVFPPGGGAHDREQSALRAVAAGLDKRCLALPLLPPQTHN